MLCLFYGIIKLLLCYGYKQPTSSYKITLLMHGIKKIYAYFMEFLFIYYVIVINIQQYLNLG